MNKQLFPAPIIALLAVAVGFCVLALLPHSETTVTVYGNSAAHIRNTATNTPNAPNIKKALLERANNGDAKAQYKLGNCYCHGDGIQRDYTNAVVWYMKAVEQGNGAARCNLGNYYEYGDGVPKDHEKAVKLLAGEVDVIRMGLTSMIFGVFFSLTVWGIGKLWKFKTLSLLRASTCGCASGLAFLVSFFLLTVFPGPYPGFAIHEQERYEDKILCLGFVFVVLTLYLSIKFLFREGTIVTLGTVFLSTVGLLAMMSVYGYFFCQ